MPPLASFASTCNFVVGALNAHTIFRTQLLIVGLARFFAAGVQQVALDRRAGLSESRLAAGHARGDFDEVQAELGTHRSLPDTDGEGLDRGREASAEISFHIDPARRLERQWKKSRVARSRPARLQLPQGIGNVGLKPPAMAIRIEIDLAQGVQRLDGVALWVGIEPGL